MRTVACVNPYRETVKNVKPMKKKRASRKTVKYTPNTRYLVGLLNARGMQAAQLAAKLKMHKSSLSRSFRGTRRPTLAEITRMAEVLGVSLEDLLHGFGIKLHATQAQSRDLTVSGWLDATLTLRSPSEGGGLHGPRVAPCPFLDGDIRVARVQTAGSEFDGLDGALVYFREQRGELRNVEASAIGKPAMVCVAGETAWRLRVIRKGYAPGKFNLTSLAGRLMEESIVVERVWPIIWIKF